MRIGYSDEEDYPNQFELWQGNCRRSLRGRKGQAFLRELEAALVALPEKRLIADDVAKAGEVCAVGAWLLKKRTEAGRPRADVLAELEAIDSEDCQTDDLAISEGAPRLCAWSVVELNDILCDTQWVKYQGPERSAFCYENNYRSLGGYPVPLTPEERYERILTWVRANLLTALKGTP